VAAPVSGEPAPAEAASQIDARVKRLALTMLGVLIGYVAVNMLTSAVGGGPPRRAAAERRAGPKRQRRPAPVRQSFEQVARKLSKQDALTPAEVTELLALMREYRPTLYVVTRCPACLLQKVLLVNYTDYVAVINCEKQRQTCIDAGVSGLPHWRLPALNTEGGKKAHDDHVGLLTKKQLLARLRRVRESRKL
jgi:hypothetical protein